MNKQFFFLDNKKHVRTVAYLLRQGHVVAGTSDTILGLLCSVDLKGKAALDTIKKREKKPYIVLIGNSKKVELFTNTIHKNCQNLIKNCWPGPLTIIVKTKDEKKDLLNETVALRVPRHEGLLKLLEYIPALYSTSANKSGQPVPKTIEDIDSDVLENVHGIICSTRKQVINPTTQPSTIIDCTGERLKVIREGAYSVDYLETICSCTIDRA